MATYVAERMVNVTKTKVNLFVVPPANFARAASDYLISVVQGLSESSCVIGTATGGTVEDIYRLTVERALIDSRLRETLCNASYFGMDEYAGLSPDNPQSYAHFMRTRLLAPVGIPQENLRLPSEETVAPAPGATDGRSVYDEMIASLGGIDVQIAGIGENGHIAFNEPGSSPTSWTRRVELAERTIAANARYFSDTSEVPREAFSMGVQTVLSAKKIILFASGRKKSLAIQRMLEGLPGKDCPASFLLTHADVTVFLDWDAAERLRSF